MIKKLDRLVRVLGIVVLGLCIGAFVSKFLVCRVMVEGESMSPTFASGDVLFINKVSSPVRGDIVVFTRNDKSYIKRVIALPGDSIVIRNSRVFVNGEVVVEAYIKEGVFDGGLIEDSEYTLLDGEYFVMGDNRNNSLDSRSFGVVYSSEIDGVKLFE